VVAGFSKRELDKLIERELAIARGETELSDEAVN
jgi:hypothetical protein